MLNTIKYNFDLVKLNDFLKKSYENLSKSIEKEGYSIDYQNFDEFYEIFNENKIVGFIAIEKSELFNTKVIVDCYIVPEARGNKLLYTSLIDLISNSRYRFLMKKPTRSLIFALISYGFAYKLTDELVVSWFDFDVTLGEVYKNSKIKKLYKKVTDENENKRYGADFFDLNINSTLFYDNSNVVSKDSKTLVIVEPRKYDIKKYNLRKKLKKISVNYLEDVNFEIEIAYDDIIEFFDDLNIELSSNFQVDNIIGSNEEIKSEAQELLEENNLTIEDGFKIRQSIIDSIENEEILSTFINYRFGFLTLNYSYIDKKIDENEKTIGCPFCNNPFEGTFYVCDSCGHKFDEILAPDEIREDISDGLNIFGDDFDSSDLSSPEFLLQFDDFNKKLADIFGEDYDLFKDFMVNKDLNGIKDLIYKKSDKSNLDWNFADDKKLDNGILKIVHEKNYDEVEVFNSQSKICLFEFLKHISENITHWKLNSINITNHVDFNYEEYALDKDYVRYITGMEFFNHLNSFSLGELQAEAKFLHGKSSDNKGEIINQLMKDGDGSLVITENGEEYINEHPLLNYFADYMSEYFFYDFERYYNNYKDEMSLEEISKKYVNEDFKSSFKKGDFEVYLRYLEFYFKYNWFNENYEDAFVFLTQRVIYEISKWYAVDSHYSFEMAISYKTVDLFDKVFNSNQEFNMEEIFTRAYKEFKFGHMKGDREILFDKVMDLFENRDFMLINSDLQDEFFEKEEE